MKGPFEFKSEPFAFIFSKIQLSIFLLHEHPSG